MDDIALFINACLAGDASNWDQVRSTALRFLRSRNSSQTEDHSDIVQEVTIKLLQGFRHFNGTTANELRHYINVTTMREAISYYRKNARHQSHDSLDQSCNDNDSGSTLHAALPDERFLPEMITELNDLYRRATDTLSIRDQQILLYKIEGFTEHEIAEMLRMSPGGVATTYSRIKELLRKTLLLALLIIFFGRKLPLDASL